MIKLLILGEAYGEEEALKLQPFVGKSGWLLDELLSLAGLVRPACHVTNVFNLQPKPTNDILNLCGSRAEGADLPPLQQGKYIRPEFIPELIRLRDEINEVKPNLVLALGGTALWAMTGVAKITAMRGSITTSNESVLRGLNRVKVLPTFHPAAILRDYSMREVTQLDFIKAGREQEFPEVIRPKRLIAVDPSLSDIASLYYSHFKHAKRLAVDIETKPEIGITCIGFAYSPAFSLVIPFFDRRKPDCNYWPAPEAEIQAWEWVRRFLDLPAEKIFQNGLYDLHHIWRGVGTTVRNAGHDTMLLHHAMQPELPKGLGFLGSLYTNEASWKLMRGKTDTIKREE